MQYLIQKPVIIDFKFAILYCPVYWLGHEVSGFVSVNPDRSESGLIHNYRNVRRREKNSRLILE
jgi:hypothetical protein